ncbi:MAG: PAQR family membrane homeostasis protein TrhA [Terracidiphilus sp.]
MHPRPRLGDILANAITHGIGAGLAIAGATYLLVASAHASARVIVACSIFSGSLILVYICSTLYHSLVLTRARPVFHILDHSSIYVLIAGTYTPFTVVSLRGLQGWVLFGVVWALAVIGVVSKSVAMDHFTRGFLAGVSAAIYLFQGWLAVFVWRSLSHALGTSGMFWLIGGGVAYTLGIVFFSLDHLPYFHATWHIFVLAGSIAHYFAILLYVVPPRF